MNPETKRNAKIVVFRIHGKAYLQELYPNWVFNSTRQTYSRDALRDSGIPIRTPKVWQPGGVANLVILCIAVDFNYYYWQYYLHYLLVKKINPVDQWKIGIDKSLLRKQFLPVDGLKGCYKSWEDYAVAVPYFAWIEQWTARPFTRIKFYPGSYPVGHFHRMLFYVPVLGERKDYQGHQALQHSRDFH